MIIDILQLNVSSFEYQMAALGTVLSRPAADRLRIGVDMPTTTVNTDLDTVCKTEIISHLLGIKEDQNFPYHFFLSVAYHMKVRTPQTVHVYFMWECNIYFNS